MRLSILIASLFERHSLLMRLLGSLAHQADRRLEVLTAIDQRHLSVGKKREHLLCRAHGDYICYLDDDDTVSDVFVKRILDALETEPDCVGYWGCIRHGSQSKKCTIRRPTRFGLSGCVLPAHLDYESCTTFDCRAGCVRRCLYV